MGIFNKLFGETEHKDNQRVAINWKNLTEVDQVSQIITQSVERPAFIFKHSTRCAISKMALKNFENHFKAADADAYFLDLLEYRGVSNHVAALFDVVHQSPQLLLIKDGKCVFTASHSDIDADELVKKIQKL